MSNLATIFVLFCVKHCDSTHEMLSEFKQSFASKLGHVRAKSLITSVSEIECFLTDPSQAVTEKAEFNIRT